ncbi:MAG TPA: response regulator [Thermoanaerobaculia bacterium]|jgi:two-component system copper resistance phosphate regulon response regulator CusR
MSPEKKVLIVEDDAAIRSFLVTLLSRDGYSPEVCGDGNDAVRMLRTNGYDAILLDLMLPGQFGFDVIRFLNAERPAMSPRVIVLTAASQATLNGFDVSQVHAVMRKPFDVDALLASVRECAA